MLLPAIMRRFQSTIFPRTAASPLAVSSSKLAASTTSASIPSVAVATLPPSARPTRGTDTGAVSAASNAPRSQCGTATGSVQTRSRRKVRRRADMSRTARSSAGLPDRRGPTRSHRCSTIS
jgi:hypothetical protein